MVEINKINEIERLQLSKQELNFISEEARVRKFHIENRELIYPNNYIDKCKYFIYNYRFLLTLTSFLNENTFKIEKNEENEEDNFEIKKKEIKPLIDVLKLRNKIVTYLETYEDLFNKLLKFYISLEKEFCFRKNKIINEINIILIENELLIDYFIDDLFSIGKIMSKYDPNASIGVK